VQADAKREYLAAIHARYHRVTREEKGRILDEFCKITGYHRKAALRRFHGAPPGRRPRPRGRRAVSYSAAVIQILSPDLLT